MTDKVVVYILQTESEQVVSREYYERYKNDGLVLRGDYKEPVKKVAAVKTKEA
jgi:metallophosphoesterase superfamily enzyme